MSHSNSSPIPICAGDWVVWRGREMVVLGIVRIWDADGNQKTGYYCRSKRGTRHFIRGPKPFSTVVYAVRGVEARGDLCKPGAMARVADRRPLERNPLADDDWAGAPLPRYSRCGGARLALPDRSQPEGADARRDS